MKSKLLLFSILFFQLSAFATHNRGGEITFRQIGPLEVEASVTTYTNANSIVSGRDTLIINWGDETFSKVVRVNGPDLNMNGVPDGEIIAPGINMSIYKKTHIYTELDRYIISMTNPNRNGGIDNVNFPNSESVKFHIQSEIQLEEDFLNNNSPVLLEPPHGIGIVGQPFMHVPNAFDIDDDSIAYSLMVPLNDEGLEVPNYQFPNMINPGPDNVLTIDPETGVMLWDAPQKAGQYVFAIRITTYNNGEIADIVIRDFTVVIEAADHLPPSITATENHPEVIHVAVGDTISIGVSTISLNDTVTLNLTATCGLFEDYYDNNSTFVATVDGNEGEGQFEWIVNEEHLRQTPYQLVFRSQDNFSEEGVPWYHVLRYRVVGTVSTDAPVTSNVSIKAYPNPTSDYVIIETKDFSTSMLYYLRDTNGKIVDTGMLTNSAHQIDLSSLPPGMYLIDIPERKQVLKIIR